MLMRKPYIGETLLYNSPISQNRLFTVTRIDGNILYFTECNQDESLIIWKFKDGLNTCLSHIKV